MKLVIKGNEPKPEPELVLSFVNQDERIFAYGELDGHKQSLFTIHPTGNVSFHTTSFASGFKLTPIK